MPRPVGSGSYIEKLSNPPRGPEMWGSVSVTLDKSAAFQLDASTSGGGVEAAGFSLAVEKISRDRNRLAGAVNGGGPLLKLRSSGGGISVRAN